MGYGKESVKAYVGTEKRGSSLIGECGEGHDKQPQGHPIGTGQKGPNLRGLPRSGDSQIFGKVSLKTPDIFRSAGHHKDGKLRMSGHSGAHRVGGKKKY